MNDDLTILASAYLDGDVTVDERAQVEASEELMLEVDRLRTVRAVLSSTTAAGSAPISMREEHLATALGAWDRLPDNERTGALRDATPSGADGAAAAGVAAMSAPPRRTQKRRRMQSPVWLGAAAAGLVIVMAGGLVLRNTANDDDSGVAEQTSADTSAEFRASEGGAADAVAPAAADDAADSELEATAQAPDGTTPIENGSDVETDLAAEAPPSDDGSLEQLNTLAELAIFASDAVGAPGSDDLPAGATVITDVPSPVLDEAETVLELKRCQGADVVVGLAIYGDETVVVGIDESRDRAVAYRQDDCSLVASAPLR